MAGEELLDDLMPAAAGPQQGESAPAAPHEASTPPGNSDVLDNLMPTGNPDRETDQPDHAAIAKASEALHGKPTRFQNSPVTTAYDARNYEQMPWSEVGASAAKSAIPSTWEAVKAVGHAAAPWNWGEDVKTVGNLAGGVKSKVQGALGVPQPPEQKQKSEALLDALFHHYGETYGSVAGFKKALATDPASLAMDASTFAGGAGAAAKAANLPKIAKIANLAATATDPIYGAVKAAKFAATPAVGLARKITGATSSVAPEFQNKIALAGAESNPELRDAYWRHFTGNAPTDEPLSAMTEAFGKLKGQTLSEMKANKRLSYANAPGAMPFNDIDTALNSEMAKATTPGAPASWKSDKLSALNKVKEWVDFHKADPSMQTMEKFDDLRAEIGDLAHSTNDARLKTTIGPIYDAVRNTMKKVSPEYTDVLERTSEAQRELKDMSRSLGTAAFQNGTAMTPTLLARQIRAMATARGRDMMSKISAIDPRIPYMLAGVATHEWSPHGLRHVAQGLAGAGGVGALAANPAAWAPIVGGTAAAFAASSPKAIGALNYGYGALDRAARSPITKGAYYAGRANELSGDQTPSENISATNLELPRNARNNNMGNIKDGPFAQSQAGYSGKEGPFARFDNTEAGINAAKKLVSTYLKTGSNTPSKIVDRWAPKGNENSDEARAAYKKRLADSLGIGIYDTIEGAPTDVILKAIAKSEGEVPRTMRSTGGRTNIDHAAEAAKLVRKAEITKNQFGKATEPLLNVSDDHIAQALSVANASI